jgi:hypothetical protein
VSTRRQMAGGLVAAALLCGGAVGAVTVSPPPALIAPESTISPWTALAAYSTNVVDADRLCYWHFRDERWIPADVDEAISLRKEDPRPIFREPNQLLGRCGGEVPVAAIGSLGAIFGAFVYIATKDDKGKFEPASPD